MPRGAKNSGSSLASVAVADIRRELLRREQKMGAVWRERDRVQAQIQRVNTRIAAVQEGGSEQGRVLESKGGAAIAHVIRIVAEEFGVAPQDILSKRRFRSMARARQVCMYLARHTCGCVLRDIGLGLDGRDHSTIIHGIEEVQKRAAESTEFAATLVTLTARLRAAMAGR